MSTRIPPLPDSVLLLGERFRVEVLKDGIDDGDTAGDMTGILKRIRIDANLDRSKQWRVLWHEILHSHLHIIGADAVLGEEMDEVITQSLEYGLLQVLRQIGPQLLLAVRAEDE